MIQDFHDAETEDIFNGTRSKKALKRLPFTLWPHAQRRLDYLNAAYILGDLQQPPGNRLEKLSGDRAGQFSIRINNQYRICFEWRDAGPARVEITDYH